MNTTLNAFSMHFCAGICAAREQELILVPGLGDKKVKRLYQALHEPFRAVKQKSAASSLSSSTSASDISSSGSNSNSSNNNSSSSNSSASGSSSSNSIDVYSRSRAVHTSAGIYDTVPDSARAASDLNSAPT